MIVERTSREDHISEDISRYAVKPGSYDGLSAFRISQNVEHGVEGPRLAPWLVAKGVADAIHVPGGDADYSGWERSIYIR